MTPDQVFTTNSSASSTTITLTVPATIPVGATIILGTNHSLTSTSVTGVASISDGLGNTWNLNDATSIAASTHDIGLHSCKVTTAIPAGTVITVTWSSSSARKAAVANVFNSGLSATKDASSGSVAGSLGSPNAGTFGSSAGMTVTATAANTKASGVVIAGFTYGGTQTISPGAGYTASGMDKTAVGTQDRGLMLEYKNVSSIETSSATATLSASGGWAAALAFYPLAAQTPPPPAPTHPIDIWINTKPANVAHRGGSKNFPECTLYAYQRSVNWGAKAIELPVWKSADGYWIVTHDQDTLSSTGQSVDVPTSNWVGTLDQLKVLNPTTGLPTQHRLALLREVLDLYAGSKIIFVENKSGNDTRAAELRALFATYPNWQGHFVWKALWSLGPNGSQAAYDAGMKTWIYCYEKDVNSLVAVAGKASYLGLDYTAAQSAWDTLKAVGKPVIAHIVGNATNATTALSKGADALMASDVLGIIPQASSKGGVAAGGARKQTAARWVKVNGVLRPVKAMYVVQNGVKKPLA